MTALRWRGKYEWSAAKARSHETRFWNGGQLGADRAANAAADTVTFFNGFRGRGSNCRAACWLTELEWADQ